MRLIRFDVIDNQTGKYPDCEKIALSEEWAKHLIYCDIDCFAITEEGDLILIDDCNNIAYPPSDRFTVTIAPESLRPKGEWVIQKRHTVSKNPYMDDNYHAHAICSKCGFCIHSENASFGYPELNTTNFCPNCGADMRGEKS